MLYIGKSCNLKSRLEQHPVLFIATALIETARVWVKSYFIPFGGDIGELERALIVGYQPELNIAFK